MTCPGSRLSSSFFHVHKMFSIFLPLHLTPSWGKEFTCDNHVPPTDFLKEGFCYTFINPKVALKESNIPECSLFIDSSGIHPSKQ